MNEQVIFHPSTLSALGSYLQTPSHAICLVGPPGAGKGFTASYLVNKALDAPAADAVLTIIGSDQGIGIEQIRELHKFLRLKKPGKAALKRAVVIENAGNMSDEAQNALLKTLEEPPADTVFVLTSDGSKALRPTIYSRVQLIHILPISHEQAKQAFPGQAADITKAYHLSGGYIGLLRALLSDADHNLVTAVEQAKLIMRAPVFERLTMVDGLAKQKELLPTLFYALHRVIGAVMAKTTDHAKLKRLVSSSRLIFAAEQDLRLNVNSKLLLTDLFLNL